MKPTFVRNSLLSVSLLVATAVQATGYRSPLPAEPIQGGAPVSCAMPPRVSESMAVLQSPVAGRMPPFRLGSATVTPLAGYSLEARVLSREDYTRFWHEGHYSPTDLALGWGPMSAPGLAQRLHVSQGGRWFSFRWGPEGPPMAPDQILTHSANVHFVPADDAVARTLSRVEAGDIVRADGWLIRVEEPGGWRWQSSLTRSDVGNGACELIYVCSLEVRR